VPLPLLVLVLVLVLVLLLLLAQYLPSLRLLLAHGPSSGLAHPHSRSW